jgi:UDP-Gal:alpha-D-GlcNAc-diphosphoundecaprenol beta-1,4-galactosyltransferase
MTFAPKLEEKLARATAFEALLAAFRSGATRRAVAIGFVNPASYPPVAADAEIRDGFDAWFVDGGLLCRLSNLFRSARLDRVSFDFSSIAPDVFALCDAQRLRVGLLGGSAEESAGAARYLAARYPRAAFVFAEHGFFPAGDCEAKAGEMAALGVQVAVVGLGTPKQERFVLRLKEKTEGAALLFTCGGFLSQTGLSGDYYPDWVKRTGLRWLYRALRHRHVRRRLLTAYPRFVVTYLASALRVYFVRKQRQ